MSPGRFTPPFSGGFGGPGVQISGKLRLHCSLMPMSLQSVAQRLFVVCWFDCGCKALVHAMSSVRADIKSVQLVESTCIYTARVCLLTRMYLLLD